VRAPGINAGFRPHPLQATLVFASLLPTLFLLPLPAAAGEPAPIASAFVFPVGDELDFKKAAPGEANGFHVTDPYLKVRKSRRHRSQRVHYGVDLSGSAGGLMVRAIAAGVVEVCDANALVKVRRLQRVKLPVVVDGKRSYQWGTRYATVWKWRTGWGNRVVVRHTLPDGQVVYSLYAHLMSRSVLVRVGDHVAAGQPIAKVGRTGRATAPHLHLEIRTTRIDESTEISDPDDSESSDEGDAAERPETELPHTVDPLAFLVDHVLRFEDLEPGSWQVRYALPAVKDGVMSCNRGRFDPNQDVTRAEFYAALVTSFRLGTPFTKSEYESQLDALIDTGILDSSARNQNRRDPIDRSDALELVLRCLDRGAARSLSMSRIPGEQLARDFNAEFAGRDAANEAERESRRLAASETADLRKAAAARDERRANAARERGAPPPQKRTKVEAVKPVPVLDPGFDSLAQSRENLSRAEVCLLLASTLRIGSANVSALQRAASRAAKTG
jgi:murein DD-endopeptidase MepM/ murein hydrolase activator NlpD